MASSTWPPGGAAPSASSSGTMPRASAEAGTSSSASNKKSNRRSIVTALVGVDWLVEVRPQPALRLLQRNAASRRIVFELVAADARHAEVLAVAMPKIEARHSGSRQHREILGERDLARMTAEHVEQQRLKAVIGAGGIARRRPDSFVTLADQLLVRQMFVGIAPEAVAHFRVQHLGETFGETVGECLQENVGIIVVRGLEPLQVRLEPVDSNRETAEPVLAFGVDKICQAHVRPAFTLLHLLPKHRQPGPVVAREHQDIVTFALAAP